MQGKKVGIIDHYYDKIGVAVVKLDTGNLKIGDKIKIYGRDKKELLSRK